MIKEIILPQLPEKSKKLDIYNLKKAMIIDSKTLRVRVPVYGYKSKYYIPVKNIVDVPKLNLTSINTDKVLIVLDRN